MGEGFEPGERRSSDARGFAEGPSEAKVPSARAGFAGAQSSPATKIVERREATPGVSVSGSSARPGKVTAT